MKLTNGEIFSVKEPLEKLLTERMPVKVSYELAKLANKLNDQLQIIEKVRGGLFKTYGSPDPSNPQQIRCLPFIVETNNKGIVNDSNGLPHMIENHEYPMFKSEIDELMGQEIEIVFDVIQLPDTLEIEPSVLMALNKFIKL